MKISRHKGRSVLALVLSLALATSATGLLAQQGGGIPLNPAHPDSYTVKSGDTLWDISGLFLRDPWYWPEIWYVNPQVANPHRIYPGEVLSLVYENGQPRLVSSRGSAPPSSTLEQLSPQVRSEPLITPVNTIPFAAIGPFLSKGLVLAKSELQALPRIVALRDAHLMGASGNDVYVRGKGLHAQSVFSVVHVGDKLLDPDNGALLGYEGIFVADGRVRRGGDPATLQLDNSQREALVGDRLITQAPALPLNFEPRAPGRPVEGRIVHVGGGLTRVGQYDVIVINRGSRDGLEAGHVLTIWQAGQRVPANSNSGGFGRKVLLPDERAGTLIVFKTYDRLSYGLVMQAEGPIHLLDKVRNPS